MVMQKMSECELKH